MKFPFYVIAVLLVLGSGCQKSTVELPRAYGSKSDMTYLETHVGKTNFGGKMFCAFAYIPEEQSDDAYASSKYWWVECQEYYLVTGELREGTGVSLPVVVTVDSSNKNIIKLDQPGDANYVAEVKRLFPEQIAKKILHTYRFTPNIRSEAEAYYAPQLKK